MCFRISWIHWKKFKSCKFWWSYSKVSFRKQLKSVCLVPARKIIQVKHELYLEDLIESSLHWLAGVWYPGEIDSAQYDTPGRLTHRGIIPCGDFNRNFNTWLAGVSYPGEIDSAEYDTLRRLTLHSRIPRGDWLCAVWYPGEIHKNSNNLVKT